MYYSGTYIGFREEEGGPVLPFYVENVDWDGDVSHMFDEDGDMYEDAYSGSEYNDYSESAYGCLIFVGYTVDDEDQSTTRRYIKGYHDPRLVFENPRLGYYAVRNNRPKQWCSYLPARSVKKGLSQNRVNFPLHHKLVFRIFQDFYKPQIERDFEVDSNGNLLYRCNVCIGTKNGDRISLNPVAGYLKRLLERLFPECQITM